MTQCNVLMRDALPYFKGLSGAVGDTIVGGDLNLEYDKGGSLNVQKCVPNGFARKGDAGCNRLLFRTTWSLWGQRNIRCSTRIIRGFWLS